MKAAKREMRILQMPSAQLPCSAVYCKTLRMAKFNANSTGSPIRM